MASSNPETVIVTPAKQQPPQAGLSTLALVFILFCCTSVGPYTTETLIHTVGPGLGLLILLLVPIIWSVPEVLIVGELASMLPEEGGYYRWVDRAFGRFWAFQNGWLTWMYSLVDMARIRYYSINICATSFPTSVSNGSFRSP